MPQKYLRMFADVTVDVTSDISAELLSRNKAGAEMFATKRNKRNKTKSRLMIFASLMAGALLLAGAGLADAKDGKSKPSQGPGIRQEGTQKDHDGHKDWDNDRKHRDKDWDKEKRHRDKDRDRHRRHRDKDKNKCGDKKKCPTPKPVEGGKPPVGGQPPVGGKPPVLPPKAGKPLAPVLSDPGYGGPPPSGGSGGGSGGGGAGSGGPSKNPIQNGGSPIKEN